MKDFELSRTILTCGSSGCGRGLSLFVALGGASCQNSVRACTEIHKSKTFSLNLWQLYESLRTRVSLALNWFFYIYSCLKTCVFRIENKVWLWSFLLVHDNYKKFADSFSILRLGNCCLSSDLSWVMPHIILHLFVTSQTNMSLFLSTIFCLAMVPWNHPKTI